MMNPEILPFPEPPMEHQEKMEIEPWYQPFTVASICRQDLRGILPDDQIAALDDNDMEWIADKMSDIYRDSGGYWESLEVMAHSRLAQQQAAETMTTEDEGGAL